MDASEPSIGSRPRRGLSILVVVLLSAVSLFLVRAFLVRRPGDASREDPTIRVPVAESPAVEPPAAEPPTNEETAIEESAAQAPQGRWRRATGEEALTPEQRSQIEELNAIGYANGSSPAPDRSGVTIHRPESAWQGLNLAVSGHAATAQLMDMDGRVLHAWSADFKHVWPDEAPRELTWYWRRVHLYGNGDLLAIFEGHSLVKLDKDSHLIWKSRCGAHHDLAVLPDGDILVLTREAHVVPAFHETEPILEDFVSVLSADGVEKRRFSIVEALDRSKFRALRDLAWSRRGDILHTNSIFVLDGRRSSEVPAFKAGNLLISSRPLSFVAVLDPARQEVVWVHQGPFRMQHDPKLLESGNLLLFDNNVARKNATKKGSAVLEIDPATGKTVWEYRGSAQAPFYTMSCGTADRLPNGNTLITESDSGRAFEVTSARDIVWEFWNPERAGDENELIATLFEVVRLGPDFPRDWLR